MSPGLKGLKDDDFILGKGYDVGKTDYLEVLTWFRKVFTLPNLPSFRVRKECLLVEFALKTPPFMKIP